MKIIKSLSLRIILVVTTILVCACVQSQSVYADTTQGASSTSTQSAILDGDDKYAQNITEFPVTEIDRSNIYTIKGKYKKKEITNNVYPINIEYAGKYQFRFVNSDMLIDFRILDSTQNIIYSKRDLYLEDDEYEEEEISWCKKVDLSAGIYYVQIYTYDYINGHYTLNIRATEFRKTYSYTLKNCDTKKLTSIIGKGDWKTSNKDIISITSTATDKSYCNIKAGKAGKATVTFSNADGAKITYKFTVSAVNRSYSYKITSCDTKKMSPNLGKGTWKTSNSSIIALTGSSKDSETSTCTVRAKKAGTATVTYTNSVGAKVKYTFTVTSSKTFPFEKAYFKVDSADGCMPYVVISNNSSKKIKYVYMTVSFYNAVGDKERDEISGNKTVKLRIVGPLSPWTSYEYWWDPVFYNSVVTKMKVETVQVIYTDGTKKNITVNKKYKMK